MKKNVCGWMAMILVLVVLFSGCSRRPEAGPSAPESVPSIPDTPESVSRLFDTLFLGLWDGTVTREPETFKVQARDRDFYVLEENGVLLIMDNERDGSFLRCELGQLGDVPVICRAVYSLELGGAQRQVLLNGLDRGAPVLSVDMTQFRDGDTVSSMAEVTTYLLSPVQEEETAPEDRATLLDLFEEIYVPVAQDGGGSLSDLQAEAESQGYFYTEGEGQFTIQDENHPDSYIYGLPDFSTETPGIAAWGYHLSTDGGEYEVLIKFFTLPAQYFTEVSLSGEGKEVDSLEQIKEYIYRSRMA